jgi:hypothetical protein
MSSTHTSGDTGRKNASELAGAALRMAEGRARGRTGYSVRRKASD